MMNSHPAGKAPSSVGGQSSGGGGFKFTKVTAGVMILAPIVAALAIAVYFMLPNYVTKVDFNKNILGVTDTVNTAKADVDKGVAAMQTKMDAFPASITNQINTGVGQATNAMNGQITTMQTQVNNMAGVVAAAAPKTSMDALAVKIDALSVKVDTIQKAVDDDLDVKVAALTTSLQSQASNVTQQIASLNAQIAALQNQANLTNISVTGSSSNWTLASGVASLAPITIVNSGTTTLTAPIKLTITSPVGVVIASATSNLNGMTVTYPSGQVVFTSSLGTLPNSTQTVNIAITVTYSGTPSGVWVYAWSRQ